MALMIDPNAEPKEGGGNRRPDCRAGQKILWLAGMKYGTSRSGNAKIDTCWAVVGDPDGGKDEGAIVFCTFTLTQRAAWKIAQVARATGAGSSFDAEDAEATWNALSARPVEAKVELKPKYSGEGTRPEIARFERFTGESDDAMEAIVNKIEEWYNEWSSKQPGAAVDEDIPF